jgi:predicted acetyltransferase
MIKITNNVDDIVKVWSEAFGDSREDIEFFIKNVKDAFCLSYYDNEQIASMMYLVKCKKGGVSGYYLYAVSTLKKYKNNGYATKLLNKAKEDCSTYLCLIPAQKSLEEFYYNRGFDKSSSVESIEFCQCDEIKEYLFEGCDLEKPYFQIYAKGEI